MIYPWKMVIFHINHHFPMVFPWFSHGSPGLSGFGTFLDLLPSGLQHSLGLRSTSQWTLVWSIPIYYEDGLTYENPWKNIWENMRNLHMKWCSLFGVPGFWPIPYPFNFCESCEKNTTPWSSLVVPSANCYCLISTYLDCQQTCLIYRNQLRSVSMSLMKKIRVEA